MLFITILLIYISLSVYLSLSHISGTVALTSGLRVDHIPHPSNDHLDHLVNLEYDNNGDGTGGGNGGNGSGSGQKGYEYDVDMDR